MVSKPEGHQIPGEVPAKENGGGGRRPKAIKSSFDVLPQHLNSNNSVDITLLSKRESISTYPRISFGTGQRFGSKGAYVRKFIADQNSFDETKAQWIVP